MLCRLLFLSWYLLLAVVVSSQPVDIVIQTGHSSSVYGVAFSPDGKNIASTCSDGSVKVWDTKLGFEVFTFYNYDTYGYDVAYSPDGKYLLGTGSNKNVLRRTSDGRKLAEIFSGDLDDAEAELSKGIFSPDGKYCFSGREDYSIMRWELKEIFSPGSYKYPYNEIPYEEDSSLRLTPPSSAFFFKGHTAVVSALAITPDNLLLVSAADKTIIIWKIQTGEKIRVIQCPFKIESMALTADGKKIITSDDEISIEEEIRIWDLTTGRQVFHIPLIHDKAKCFAVSRDGKYFAAGNLRSTIDIYSALTYKKIKTLKGHDKWINGLAFSPDSKWLVSGSEDNSIKIWDVTTGKIVRDFRRTIANIDRLCYENNHRLLTTTSGTTYDQSTITWELENGIGIKNRYHGKANLRSDLFLQMDTAGHTLMINEDSAIQLFNAVTGQLKKRYPVPYLGSALLSPDGSFIFYQNRKTDSLFLFHTDKATTEFFATHPNTDTATRYPVITRYVDAIDISKDGQLVAAGGSGPDVYIWNLATKQYLRNLNYLDPDSSERKNGDYYENEELTYPNSAIYDLKFSPDGKLIAAAVHFPDPLVYGGLLVVWETATGKLLHWKTIHTYRIQSVNWSPDGKYLVTGSNDKWVKVWRYSDFTDSDIEPVYAYQHDFTSMHTSYTPDNKWIISAGIDGKIIIKENESYKTIATLIGLNTEDYVAITADKYYAASRQATKLIAFRQGNKVFPVEQFDLRYNRPDKVMEALGSTDTALIRSYRNAYYKRIKRMGLDTAFFREGLTAPEFDIVGREMISYQANSASITINLQGKDDHYLLDRFNLWVNEVPLFGQKGIRLLYRNKNSFDTSITVSLSQGENRIETSITNVNGTESFRQPLVVNYTPTVKQKELIRFVGIGIDKFADSRHDLTYSSKDIRDLAKKLKQKYGNDLVIDTLFNEDVTIDNIKALKQKLKQTTVNDKVVISYSGHGLLSRNYDYYLSTYNVSFSNPEENGLPYEELENLLDSIPARKKLMLIDACHSGEVDKEEGVLINNAADSLGLTKGIIIDAPKESTNRMGLKNSFELMQSLFVNVGKSTGATIISAAAGNQFALERGDLKNGVFTYSILEALNKYPSMKISELKKIVSERVEQLTNGLQKPTSRNENIAMDWNLW